mgnify:CR=1 FL=1
MTPRLGFSLLAGFGALIVLTGVLGISQARRAAQIERELIAAQEAYSATQSLLAQTRVDLYRIGMDVRDYLLDRSADSSAELRQQLEDTRVQIKRNLEMLESRMPLEDREPLAKLREEVDDYIDWMSPAIQWTQEEKLARSGNYVRSVLLTRRKSISGLAEQVEAINNANLQRARARLEASQAEFQTWIRRLTAIVLVMSVLIAGLSTTWILRLEKKAELGQQRAEEAERELRRLSQQLVKAQEDERRALSREQWWLVAWAAVPFVFYSISVGKQPRYVLPILPPLAILLARSIEWRVASPGDTGRQRTLRWCTVAAAGILLLLGALLHRAKPLLFALDPATGTVATTVIVVAGAGLLARAWARRPAWLPVGIAAASVATLLSLPSSIYSAEGMGPVQKMAAVFRMHWPGASASGTYRVFVRNLVFYTGVKQTDLTTLEDLRDFLARPERVLVVSSEDDLRQLAAIHGVTPRRLEQVTYFNPSGVRLRTLLSPDPEKDLETVWLVSNQ